VQTKHVLCRFYLNPLGQTAPKVVHTIHRVAMFIIHIDHLLLDYRDYLFKCNVQTQAVFFLALDMDMIKTLDGLATVLRLRGTLEALKEANCLTRTESR
jgi:hypothetical protein